jgi:hypothetical protein
MTIHRSIVFVCWWGRGVVGQIDCPSTHQHVKITASPAEKGRVLKKRETRDKEEGAESGPKVDSRLPECIHGRSVQGHGGVTQG